MSSVQTTRVMIGFPSMPRFCSSSTPWDAFLPPFWATMAVTGRVGVAARERIVHPFSCSHACASRHTRFEFAYRAVDTPPVPPPSDVFADSMSPGLFPPPPPPLLPYSFPPPACAVIVTRGKLLAG